MFDGVTRNARHSADRICGEKSNSLFAELVYNGRRYELSGMARCLGRQRQALLTAIGDVPQAGRGGDQDVPDQAAEDLLASRERLRACAVGENAGKPWKASTYDPLLAVQRFVSATLTDTPFRRPAGYDFEKAMNQGFGIWNQKRFRVVLELTGWAADFARERVWSPEQRITETKDGGIRLEF